MGIFSSKPQVSPARSHQSTGAAVSKPTPAPAPAPAPAPTPKLNINSYFKNQLTHNEPVIWLFSSHSGGWWFMNKDDTQKMEQGYQSNWQPFLGITVDFNRMTQRGKQVNRYLIRMTRAEFDQLEQEYNRHLQELKQVWVCVIPSKTGAKDIQLVYPPRIQAHLNQVHKERQPGDQPIKIKLSSGYSYFIDFDRMIQRNTSSDKSRKIKQVSLSDPDAVLTGSFGFLVAAKPVRPTEAELEAPNSPSSDETKSPRSDRVAPAKSTVVSPVSPKHGFVASPVPDKVKQD